MKPRFAFAGFRHSHIIDLYDAAKEHDAAEVVAAAEDHETTANGLASRNVDLTHKSIQDLFADSDIFDVLAVGDYYGRRGSLAIQGLELGKHIILDKPVCTRIKEWELINTLSRSKKLAVGCQLTNRDHPVMITLKRLIREGVIGKVQTVCFMGQHPLRYGTRPAWYFEEGKHGGTINDIAVHAVDILPWLLGVKFSEVIAARVWNNSFDEHPSFDVCAQMMMLMKQQIGVMGDVSYLSPDSQGYTVPQYWRYTLHGENGILETSITDSSVRLWRDDGTGEESFDLDPGREAGYLDDFLNEISGNLDACDLTSEQVLESARITLLLQNAADRGLTHVSLVPTM